MLCYGVFYVLFSLSLSLSLSLCVCMCRYQHDEDAERIQRETQAALKEIRRKQDEERIERQLYATNPTNPNNPNNPGNSQTQSADSHQDVSIDEGVNNNNVNNNNSEDKPDNSVINRNRALSDTYKRLSIETSNNPNNPINTIKPTTNLHNPSTPRSLRRGAVNIISPNHKHLAGKGLGKIKIKSKSGGTSGIGESKKLKENKAGKERVSDTFQMSLKGMVSNGPAMALTMLNDERPLRALGG